MPSATFEPLGAGEARLSLTWIAAAETFGQALRIGWRPSPASGKEARARPARSSVICSRIRPVIASEAIQENGRCIASSPSPVERRASFDALWLLAMTATVQLYRIML